MKLKFFQPKSTGKAPAKPGLSIRSKGQISLNAAGTLAINAEPGEAATICFDEEAERWLLCHWPNGQDGYPTLRALSGKSTGLRFQVTAAADELFALTAYRALTSVACLLDITPLTDEQAPGATLYAIVLPATPAASSTSRGKGAGNRG
jgi:hypothetical protein